MTDGSQVQTAAATRPTQRTEDERPDLAQKDAAVDRAIAVAVAAADGWDR